MNFKIFTWSCFWTMPFMLEAWLPFKLEAVTVPELTSESTRTQNLFLFKGLQSFKKPERDGEMVVSSYTFFAIHFCIAGKDHIFGALNLAPAPTMTPSWSREDDARILMKYLAKSGALLISHQRFLTSSVYFGRMICFNKIGFSSPN